MSADRARFIENWVASIRCIERTAIGRVRAGCLESLKNSNVFSRSRIPNLSIVLFPVTNSLRHRDKTR
jgi:hypothetical protein